MGSPIRITGMNSGLDTESIIKALTQKQQDKVDNLEKDQKRFSWKQEKWKELNKKVTDLYNGTLAEMRFTTAFTKKTTTASRPSAVTVVTGENAMNTTQKMKVKSMASNAYMTGSTVSKSGGGKVTSGTKLSELAGASFSSHVDEVDKTASTYKAKTNEAGEELFLKLDENGEAVTDESGELVYKTQAEIDSEIEAAKSAAAEGADLDAIAADISKNYLKAYQEIDPIAEGTVLEEGTNPTYHDADLSKLKEIKASLEDEEEGSLLDGTTDYRQKQTVQNTQSFQLKFGENGTPLDITIDANTTVGDLVNKIKGLSENGSGLDVNFDENQQRFYIASKKSGEDAGFSLIGLDGTDLGKALGLDTTAADFKGKYEAGSNAEIELNGITYTSDKNNFEINGLTITVNETTKNSNGDYDEITLTTKSDSSGTYDMVKKFIKEYSELINEMDKLYHADNAKSYKMLSDDEKEAMGEDDAKAWEEKIKDGLLSRDQTLGDVASAMKAVMSSVFTVKDGNGNDVNATLSTFGINTLSYFEAKENEKYALYIDGDKDSDNYNVKAAEDKLNRYITNDPDLVTNFFTTLSKALYKKLSDLMSVSQFSSSYTLYEDKMMNKQYSAYTDKIADANDKLGKAEEKYYKKFGKMESTLGTLNSTQSALSGYFGG